MPSVRPYRPKNLIPSRAHNIIALKSLLIIFNDLKEDGKTCTIIKRLARRLPRR